jgi:DNA gyrase subunit B
MLSSEQVGTLVTALGCGIGRTEMDLAKLRYHRVIIMTDADVDGSHIRTLLLTFFFRHMGELIERSHVYIAQAPLYKVKKGRQERYVKDDEELDAYFLQSALEGSKLYVNADAPGIDDAYLEKLARDYLGLIGRLEALDRVYPLTLTRALLDSPALSADALADRERMAEWIAKYREALPEGQEYAIELEHDREHDIYRPRVVWQAHGIAQSAVLGHEFFISPDYARLREVADTLTDLLQEGAYVERGDRERPVASFPEALEWMLDEARRGVDLQRYKGLGEMNPGQLWETTMDPDVRRMARVTVDDAIAADQMFTTLMGERVEPRREFIENNALDVVNLDV